MKVNKLKGDKIRKVLHLLNKDCSVQGFLNLNKFLGEKFVLSRPEDELKLFFRDEAGYFTFSFTNFSKQEMGRIYKIILLVLERKVSCNTFNDHVDFYRFLEKYETMKWKSESYEDFNDEHIRWTEKYQFYTTGIYERTYSQDFENFLIKPLILDEETFFPVLLKTSSEYNMESTIQSNCVKTYVNKAENFIVSLRKKSKDSTERATVEYMVVFNDGKFYPKRVQSLGRFNKRLDVEFESILNILDVRVKELFQEKLYTLPTIKITKGHTITLSKAIVKRTLLNGYIIDWDSNEILDTTNFYRILDGYIQNDDVEIPELF